MNLVLIGYRGTGKTSVGKILAGRLGWAFVDTDAVIVERAGKTIRVIFAESGEKGFRDLETRAVREVASRPGPPITTSSMPASCRVMVRVL